MSHVPENTGFRELSGPFALAWAIWGGMFIANVVLNTPAIIFLSLVLIPFLVIEILGATAPQPEGENHKIAHTLSECMQRITYHAKTARAIPVSWAALAVFGVAGLLAWKTAWVILTLSLFGNSADTVSAVIIGITIFLWNAPHWWDPRNFG